MTLTAIRGALTTHLPKHLQHRTFSFTFAGPRKLADIIKLEMLKNKTKAEVSEIWMTYHEEKERVHGLVQGGKEGKNILKRAQKCPFFIQPIFRDNGYFMLLSQFQQPSHFLMAYLEDYKMDPSRAQPLLTFSIFNDLSDTISLSLIRCDNFNKNIEDVEALAVVQNLVQSYKNDEEYFYVETFNDDPEKFDVDDFISCMSRKWKKGEAKGMEEVGED